MLFCPKCNTIYDIKQKSSKSELVGGKKRSFDEIIDDIIGNVKLSKDDIETIRNSGDAIYQTKKYKSSTREQKDYIDGTIYELMPGEFKKSKVESKSTKDSTMRDAYFYCIKCGYNEQPVEPGTLLYEKGAGYEEKTLEIDDYGDMIYDSTLLRDRKYTCPNAKCESHTDVSKREAVVFREHHESFRSIYVCTACKTSFRL